MQLESRKTKGDRACEVNVTLALAMIWKEARDKYCCLQALFEAIRESIRFGEGSSCLCTLTSQFCVFLSPLLYYYYTIDIYFYLRYYKGMSLKLMFWQGDSSPCQCLVVFLLVLLLERTSSTPSHSLAIKWVCVTGQITNLFCRVTVTWLSATKAMGMRHDWLLPSMVAEKTSICQDLTSPRNPVYKGDRTFCSGLCESVCFEPYKLCSHFSASSHRHHNSRFCHGRGIAD